MEFKTEELNEVATLLHCTSEIATNHPSLGGIQRACQRRLAEINTEFLVEEKRVADAVAKEAAAKAAADYKAPKPGDPNYIAPEKPLPVTPPEGPANSAFQTSPGSFQRHPTDTRTPGEKLMDQPVQELPHGQPSEQATLADRRV